MLDILLGSFSPLQNLLRELVISAHRCAVSSSALVVYLLGGVSFEVLPSTCRHTAAWLTRMYNVRNVLGAAGSEPKEAIQLPETPHTLICWSGDFMKSSLPYD